MRENRELSVQNQPINETKELRILIVRLSALGDTALTLPLLFALRECHPVAYIGWVVGEGAAPLLEGMPALNRTHVLKNRDRNPIGLWRLACELNAENYVLSIDAQGLAISAMIPALARIKKRVGFASGHLEGREFSPMFYTTSVRPPDDLHYVSDRIISLFRGPNTAPPKQTSVTLPRNTNAENKMEQWCQDNKVTNKVMVFGIGAGWPTKIWSINEVRVLVEAAKKQGYTCILLWGPRERNDIQLWMGVERKGVLLAPPTDIPGMIALIRRSERYAGPDSAPLHLASLLGKPTFSWFGASDPSRCAPRGPLHTHVSRGPHNWRRRSMFKYGLQSLTGKDALPVFERWLTETTDVRA